MRKFGWLLGVMIVLPLICVAQLEEEEPTVSENPDEYRDCVVYTIEQADAATAPTGNQLTFTYSGFMTRAEVNNVDCGIISYIDAPSSEGGSGGSSGGGSIVGGGGNSSGNGGGSSGGNSGGTPSAPSQPSNPEPTPTPEPEPEPEPTPTPTPEPEKPTRPCNQEGDEFNILPGGQCPEGYRYEAVICMCGWENGVWDCGGCTGAICQKNDCYTVFD